MIPKVILVTGASSGLGAAIAERLRQRGHRVYGTSRTPPYHADRDLALLSLDVTDDASVSNCVAEVLKRAGRLDVLINNAGIGLCGAIEDTTLDEARWQLETNFFGVVRLVQAVLPVMREQGRGRIITVSSLAGMAALPYQPYYSSSKFALEGFNEALRLELSGTGIDATTINPGDFRTGFTAARVFARSAHSGAHTERLQRTLSIYERDETNGADPKHVAALAERLVAAPRVGVRYTVGRVNQRIGMLLKRVLPATLFERLMAITYRLN